MANDSPVVEEGRKPQVSDTEFDEARRAKAAEQNLSSEDAVPEQRPIASQEPNPVNAVSDLTRKLTDMGEINNKPMGKEAYDRAASQAQMDKAAEASMFEALKAGDVVLVTKGPHEGRRVAITRVVSYRDVGDLAIQTSGRPEANYVQPKELEGRARGDDRDGEMLILDVDEAGLKKINNWMGTGRG